MVWNKGLTGINYKNHFKNGMKGTFKIGHNINLGKIKNQEIKNKISESCKGRTAWNKGKPNPLAKNLPQSFKNINHSKQNHWNWQGGITPETERARKIIAYHEWQLSVFKRDNYTCQNCGIIGLILHAHHIKSFAKNKELRYDVENGMTLCKKCHNEKHKKGGLV